MFCVIRISPAAGEPDLFPLYRVTVHSGQSEEQAAEKQIQQSYGDSGSSNPVVSIAHCNDCDIGKQSEIQEQDQQCLSYIFGK